jgi:ABC-type Fe3+-citrate transport system substrate-binding protein
MLFLAIFNSKNQEQNPEWKDLKKVQFGQKRNMDINVVEKRRAVFNKEVSTTKKKSNTLYWNI